MPTSAEVEGGGGLILRPKYTVFLKIISRQMSYYEADEADDKIRRDALDRSLDDA